MLADMANGDTALHILQAMIQEPYAPLAGSLLPTVLITTLPLF